MTRSLVAVLATFAVAGCFGGKTTAGNGERFENLSDLGPDAKIPAAANLKIGEVNVPVVVRQEDSEDRMVLTLEAHGQTFEKEVYRVTSDSFELVEGAGEVYESPMPVLKFPLTVGESWTWKGTMSSGDGPHDATANIATAAEPLLLPVEGSTPSVLVVVDLSIQGAGPSPATRKLRFWFVKDKGLVKRQFGIASSREPAK